MHKIEQIRELTDDICVRDLYLIIAVLSGTMTIERAAQVSRSYPDYIRERIEIAKRVAAMQDENEEEIWGNIRRGNPEAST
jgi:hypothetical protein